MSKDYQSKWDESYRRGENHLFWPAEEVVRFINKYVRKQLDVHGSYRDIMTVDLIYFLSIGCGMGRHLHYGNKCLFHVFGIDISHKAVGLAQKYVLTRSGNDIQQGSSVDMPWADAFFHVIVSHGTIDSMPFADAQATMLEAWRVLRPGGYFYFNLIEGGDGETVIEGEFEHGTVQIYYTLDKIDELLSSRPWEVCEKLLNIRHDILKGVGVSRWHVVLRKGENE